MRATPFVAMAVLLAAALAISGCTAPPSPASTATPPAATTAPPATPTPAAGGAAEVVISMKNVQFVQKEAKVKVGTKVTWKNEDVMNHDVQSDAVHFPDKNQGVAFKSGAPGAMKPGDTYSYTFDKPGTYTYHCHLHSAVDQSAKTVSGMTGTVVVEA